MSGLPLNDAGLLALGFVVNVLILPALVWIGSALWNMNGRLAKLEEKVRHIDDAVTGHGELEDRS